MDHWLSAQNSLEIAMAFSLQNKTDIFIGPQSASHSLADTLEDNSFSSFGDEAEGSTWRDPPTIHDSRGEIVQKICVVVQFKLVG